jgi:uncharacterized protein
MRERSNLTRASLAAVANGHADMASLSRRQCLAAATALALGGRGASTMAAGKAADADILLTAWDDTAGRHHIGLLQIDNDIARIVAALEVPTRAHGLVCVADGSVYAVARRPGDWLLHWRPQLGAPPAGRQVQRWAWALEDRRFNGHLLLAADGQTLYSTETDLASGQGLLVRRDAATLEETAAWPTAGADPHDLEWLADGRLLVANGGIRGNPETGRAKLDLQRMDSSLVAIDPGSGRLSGQWRLADRWLGMRHLSRHHSGCIGVALQAEHTVAAELARAPVLAIFDPWRDELRTVPSDHDSAAYAGDITQLPEGWALSCPRDDELLRADPAGGVTGHHRMASVCALASPAPGTQDGQAAWAVGATAVWRLDQGGAAHALPPGCRFDNHAVLWTGPSAQAG